MLKEYMSKLPFLQSSQSKPRRKDPRPTEKDMPPAEEENLWPEGDPFASAPQETEPEESAVSSDAAATEQPDLFASGADAYRAGDYALALEKFLLAAGQGHVEAQFLCGQMYRRGIGAAANDRLALSWYKRAAKQGHLGGQLACASIYEDGRGTEVDLKRALSWYELAAKQGDVNSQLKCGYMYYGGRADTRNPKKARRWLEAAAENGSQEAKKFLDERF